VINGFAQIYRLKIWNKSRVFSSTRDIYVNGDFDLIPR